MLGLYRSVGWTAYTDNAQVLQAALIPYRTARQKVLLTDNAVAQGAFYQGLGFQEASELPAGPLRAFVRFDA